MQEKEKEGSLRMMQKRRNVASEEMEVGMKVDEESEKKWWR
jgi:hypothetical protein